MTQLAWSADSYRCRDGEIKGHVFLAWSGGPDEEWAATVRFRAETVTDLGEYSDQLTAMDAVGRAINRHKGVSQ